MNKYILFESPQEVKIIRLELARSGRGGYTVKLEQVNHDGTVKCMSKSYLGKTFSEMGPKLVRVKQYLVKQGITPNLIHTASKIMNMENIETKKAKQDGAI